MYTVRINERKNNPQPIKYIGFLIPVYMQSPTNTVYIIALIPTKIRY